MNDGLARIWKAYPGIFLEELSKTKNLSRLASTLAEIQSEHIQNKVKNVIAMSACLV
jgi:hypothetical protein